MSDVFSRSTPVDADEIKRLGKRFKKLDLDNSGSLSVEEFMSLPELQQNPLVQRVIEIFDTDGNGEVDFKGEACEKTFSCTRNQTHCLSESGNLTLNASHENMRRSHFTPESSLFCHRKMYILYIFYIIYLYIYI